MRKTKEGLSVLTALEKAELKLSEAIEMAKYESKIARKKEKNSSPLAEDLPHKKSGTEPQIQEKYNYTHIDEETESQAELKENTKNDSTFDEHFSNEPVSEPAKDEGKDIQALATTFDEPGFREKSILNQSKEYEIESFNELDLSTGALMEADDIMPSSFILESFSDESEEIQPYLNNELLLEKEGFISAEGNTTQFVAELLEKAQTEAEAISEGKDEKEHHGELKNKGIAIVQQAKKEANTILETAETEAQEIKKRAEIEAKKIVEEKIQIAEATASEKGYREGFEKGQNQGYIEAMEATNQQMIEEAKAFKIELQQSLQDFEERKVQLIEDHLNDLTNLALTVAEKIVKISLKSSKDVISKLIVAAAEGCGNKEWAKVYISNEDKALTLNLEKGLIDVLRQISPNIKVVVMEGEPSGTCIIETPDQIIDASVNVQLESIKQIVNDNEL